MQTTIAKPLLSFSVGKEKGAISSEYSVLLKCGGRQFVLHHTRTENEVIIVNTSF